MRVCEAKRLIHDVCGMVKEFREYPEKREKLRKGIDDVLGLFSDEVVCELKGKLKKTGKKRLREKKRRNDNKNMRREIMEDRRVKEKEIDGWLQRNQENEARLRLQEGIRRQADVVLHTVRKQKIEAKRYLKLIPGLVQLRELRYQRDASQSGMASNTDFQESMERLKSLWENQYDEYCKEEIALKEMLASGSATRLASEEQEASQILSDWELAMFREQHHNHFSWNELVSVRSHWDQFLVSDDSFNSSSIPPGWLVPLPLTDLWKDSVNFY